MKTIICQKDIKVITEKMSEHISKEGPIGGIRHVEESNDQVVILLHSRDITDEMAQIWWEGYQAALS